MNGKEAREAGYTNGTPVSAAQSQKNKDNSSNSWTSTQDITKYKNSFTENAPALTQEDRDGMARLVEHNAEEGGALQGVVAQIPGIGPLSLNVNKAVTGFLKGDAYKSLSPQAQSLVADYYTSVIANFVTMKQKLGSVGRNPQLLQAETASIPMPYLPMDAAEKQFTNKLDDMRMTYSSIPHIRSMPQTSPEGPPAAGVNPEAPEPKPAGAAKPAGAPKATPPLPPGLTLVQ